MSITLISYTYKLTELPKLDHILENSFISYFIHILVIELSLPQPILAFEFPFWAVLSFLGLIFYDIFFLEEFFLFQRKTVYFCNRIKLILSFTYHRIYWKLS